VRVLFRATPTATWDLSLHVYGLIQKTGTHVPQWDSNRDARIIRSLHLRSNHYVTRVASKKFSMVNEYIWYFWRFDCCYILFHCDIIDMHFLHTCWFWSELTPDQNFVSSRNLAQGHERAYTVYWIHIVIVSCTLNIEQTPFLYMLNYCISSFDHFSVN
jgi:hypothetical protein